MMLTQIVSRRVILAVPVAVVDHVVLTHIHSDHIGWNTARSSGRWVPRCSNARYHVHGVDVAWRRDGDDESVRKFAEAMAPLESADNSTRRSGIAT